MALCRATASAQLSPLSGNQNVTSSPTAFALGIGGQGLEHVSHNRARRSAPSVVGLRPVTTDSYAVAAAVDRLDLVQST
jgi:hypothetical protein